MKHKPILSRRRFLHSSSLLSVGLGMSQVMVMWLLVITFLSGSTTVLGQSFVDKSVDLAALPIVPDEFTVTLFASEPMVRQPCSMATVFDGV